MKKRASIPGQDLRKPSLGGAKFPTGDSLAPAQKRLHQSSAEVGPQPATTYSMMGKMKQATIGDVMDPMMTDPLVLYLKKVAAKDTAKVPPALTDLLDGSRMKDNLDFMPLGKEEHELASLPPQSTPKMDSKGKSEMRESIEDKFVNEQAQRKKSYDKDHPWEGFDQGVVDRILGL